MGRKISDDIVQLVTQTLIPLVEIVLDDEGPCELYPVNAQGSLGMLYYASVSDGILINFQAAESSKDGQKLEAFLEMLTLGKMKRPDGTRLPGALAVFSPGEVVQRTCMVLDAAKKYGITAWYASTPSMEDAQPVEQVLLAYRSPKPLVNNTSASHVTAALELSAREVVDLAAEWTVEEVQYALELETSGRRRALVIRELENLVGSGQFLPPPTAAPSRSQVPAKNPYDEANQKALRVAKGTYTALCTSCGAFTPLDARVIARALGSKVITREDSAKETMITGAKLSFSKKKQLLAEQMRQSMMLERQAASQGFFCQNCGARLIP